MVPRPTSASPGNLLEMQFLKPHPRPTDSKPWVGPSIGILTNSLIRMHTTWELWPNIFQWKFTPPNSLCNKMKSPAWGPLKDVASTLCKPWLWREIHESYTLPHPGQHSFIANTLGVPSLWLSKPTALPPAPQPGHSVASNRINSMKLITRSKSELEL